MTQAGTVAAVAPPHALLACANSDVVLRFFDAQEQLDGGAPDARMLLLDPVLCDALYKGIIKKGEIFPTHIAKVGRVRVVDGTVLIAGWLARWQMSVMCDMCVCVRVCVCWRTHARLC
jgi:hypothetical protein